MLFAVIILRGRILSQMNIKIECLELLGAGGFGRTFLFPLGIGLYFLILFLLAVLVLVLIVHIAAEVFDICIFFLLLVLGKCLLTILALFLLDFDLFLFLLLSSFGSLNDHLLPALLVLQELLAKLRGLFIPFTHYLNCYKAFNFQKLHQT